MHDGGSAWSAANWLERLELLGSKEWLGQVKVVRLTHKGGASELDFRYSEETGRLVVRKPGVPMTDDWTISLRS